MLIQVAYKIHVAQHFNGQNRSHVNEKKSNDDIDICTKLQKDIVTNHVIRFHTILTNTNNTNCIPNKSKNKVNNTGRQNNT